MVGDYSVGEHPLTSRAAAMRYGVKCIECNIKASVFVSFKMMGMSYRTAYLSENIAHSA